MFQSLVTIQRVLKSLAFSMGSFSSEKVFQFNRLFRWKNYEIGIGIAKNEVEKPQ